MPWAKPLEEPLITTLSWGAGVQSTTLLAMSALGDLPKLDAAITADTGWERGRTYETIEWYSTWAEERGIKVYRVSAGDVRTEGAAEHIHIPFWTSNGGPLSRQCTKHYKITPIKHQVRQLLGYKPTSNAVPPPGAVEQWLGISLDEYTRMKDSRVKYIKHRWPLVEKRLTRNDCIDYLEAHDLPVPIKSSCIGCPYRRASEWLQMQADAPAEWLDAVDFDEENRHNPLASQKVPVESAALYIYQSGPLNTADLVADARRERQAKQLPLLCEGGYCHV